MAAQVARFFEVHPKNPRQRTINQGGPMIQQDALIAYPHRLSGYPGCQAGQCRRVEQSTNCGGWTTNTTTRSSATTSRSWSQFVFVSNKVFRLIKAHTPGSYTFILPAAREVPRRFMNPKKAPSESGSRLTWWCKRWSPPLGSRCCPARC